MNITEILPGIHYVGVNDRTTTRFEGLWSLPQGVSYNAYLVADEKVALIDTVEEGFGSRLTENIREAIGDRKIDYLVINHMEPDHSSSVRALRMLYPDIQIVGNAKTLQMLQGFYGIDTGTLEVKEGDSISLGSKTLSFYMAPMVHWPETMVTWCAEAGTLFSGDAFGTFGAIDGGITDSQIDPSRYWDEMRRYYACIVGKYGGPVQKALAKVRGLNPTTICSTHGPVWQREIPQVMTYNGGLYPPVARLLDLIAARCVPQRNFGWFGSFCWASAAVRCLGEFAQKMKWEAICEPVEMKQGFSPAWHEACHALAARIAGCMHR